MAPEAQLDRFLLKIRIEFPGEDDEHVMVRQVTTNQVGDRLNVDGVGTIIKPGSVLALQRFVASLTVDPRVSDYAVRVCRATRTWPGISSGASPRGGIAMVRAARAHALIHGRDFVTPEDVKAVALPALRHRVTLAPELEIEGQTADVVLKALLNKVEAPRTQQAQASAMKRIYVEVMGSETAVRRLMKVWRAAEKAEAVEPLIGAQ